MEKLEKLAEPVIAVNRKAYHDYDIQERIEAGLVLTGTEVKSIRQGRVSLRDAFAQPQRDGLWLLGAHVALYQAGGANNHNPTRPRKLLLHGDEIARLTQELGARRLAVVPLKLYFKGGRIKVELALARGKKLYDKRRALREKEAEREIERAIKGRK